MQAKKLNVLDVLILFFVGSVYLSTFVFNHAPLNVNKLNILALLTVLYFIFRLIFQIFQQRQWKIQTIFCFILIISGLTEAILGLRQLYGYSASQHALFRVTGSFFNPGPYAGFLAVVFPVALYYGLKKDMNLLAKALAISGCIAIILALPPAMSRASWLAVLAGSIVIVASLPQCTIIIAGLKRITTRRKWHIVTIGSIALLLLAAIVGMYFLKKNSADGRLLTWKISLQTLAHHPLGTGLGNFSGAYGDMQACYFASDRASETEELVAGNPEYGFNEYLQIGIESGIAALLLFIAIIIQAFRLLRRKKDWGAMGSLTALLVFACFSYPFSIWQFLIVFVFLLATSHPLPAANQQVRFFRRWRVKPAMTVLCLPVAAFCLYRQYPVYKANKVWKENKIYYQSGLYQEAIQSYEPLYPYLNDQIQFLFEYAQCLSKTGIDGKQNATEQIRHDYLIKSNAVLQRAMYISCDPMLYNVMGKNYQAMKEYASAEAAYLRATQLVPSRLYPWYLLAKLYNEMGQRDKACETAKIVLTKEPKVQSTAVREMREEMKKIKN